MLDFGKDASGRLFVASELCEGQPLDRLVAATGPLPLDRAKAIVAQIGEALLEGQKVGVVHHDLSPKNVLISGSDEVKVINFVAPFAVSRRSSACPSTCRRSRRKASSSISARTPTAWAASWCCCCRASRRSPVGTSRRFWIRSRKARSFRRAAA